MYIGLNIKLFYAHGNYERKTIKLCFGTSFQIIRLETYMSPFFLKKTFSFTAQMLLMHCLILPVYRGKLEQSNTRVFLIFLCLFCGKLQSETEINP